MSERIFHVATREDWDHAVSTGTYTTSTLGRSLADVGFIHACRRDQVGRVFREHYRGAGRPLVLLTIDPARLHGVELRHEQVGDDTFPHLHGPLATSAVVDVRPLDRNGSTGSLTSLFLAEMGLRMGLALLVMVGGTVGIIVGAGTGSSVGPLLGAVAGMALGGLAAAAVLRRRSA